MTCEYCMKCKCPCPQIKFCWRTTTRIHSLLSVAAFHAGGRDHVACKASNIDCLTFHIKRLLIPVLKESFSTLLTPKPRGKRERLHSTPGKCEVPAGSGVEEQHPAYLRPSSRHHSGQKPQPHLWPLDRDTLTWVSSSPAASCRCLKIRMFLVIY